MQSHTPEQSAHAHGAEGAVNRPSRRPLDFVIPRNSRGYSLYGALDARTISGCRQRRRVFALLGMRARTLRFRRSLAHAAELVADGAPASSVTPLHTHLSFWNRHTVPLGISGSGRRRM